MWGMSMCDVGRGAGDTLQYATIIIGGAKVIFKLLLRKIAHCKHDQKKFFLSNAPTYKVCFHRSNFDLLEQS